MNSKALFVLFSENLSPRLELIENVFVERGYEVEYIAWKRNKITDKKEKFKYINLPAENKLSLMLYLPVFLYRVVKIIRLLSPTSLVLTHYATLPIAMALKGRNVFIFYDAAEMFVEDLSCYFGFLRNIAFRFFYLFEIFFLQNVDGITTVDSKDDFLVNRFKKQNKNSIVLWNVPSIKQEKNIICKVNIFDNKEVICYIGGIFRDKGLYVIIEAAINLKKINKNILFVLIGRMKEKCKLNEIIVQNELEDNILFIGQIDYEEMLNYLRQSKVGLALYQKRSHYPLMSAGNSRKIFSYMQAGIPIIGPIYSETGIIIAKTKCGILVDTANVTDVTNAIDFLLKNPNVALEMGSNGRKAVEDRYNWENESKKIDGLITNILGKGVNHNENINVPG